ncbi:YeiH family protein [Cellulomonas chengniuliangii]|uniref:Sulfate exporter family transporter n=1 Tax=Cellulomonas chengniuliangii TaxID=2968084 RepID=A0ABY5L5V8_9CELL|nr:putative sulfate exporter family transporter [Cellulomonas chengniuliangii]MCC2307829.1 putative sulfate exporter family transporter [Cellulomonas chengniuliangii]UUI76855.1 putative sulfate exporter family transporter [Cellulomonas chengniuliangii]
MVGAVIHESVRPDRTPPAPLIPAAPPTGAGRAAVLPGVLAAGGVAAVCVAVSAALPTFPVLLAAIGAGLAARVLRLVRPALEPGLAWTSRHVLRAGVVLLGLQVSAAEVLSLGAAELAVLGVTVAVTFCATRWLGPRLGVGRGLSLLVATGSSICGAAAVAAMSPVADADEDDVATAVATVTLYGSIAILVVPLLASAAGLDDRTAGLWAGMSVHEVAQVVAAAGAVSATALAVSVVAKLARVVLLAPLVAVVGLRRRRSRGAQPGARPPMVPLFVVGFLVAVAVRSSGLAPGAVTSTARVATTLALGAAMVALGSQVHVGRLVRSGGRALRLGAAATAIAMSVSLGGLLLTA